MERRRWLTEAALTEFIALTQLLPGPSSSQTGFLIGLARGGIAGGIAAWLGFTLPSAVIMVLFAAGVRRAHGPFIEGALHGLQVAAIAVVASAVLAMFRRLCPDWPRALFAAGAAALVLLRGGSAIQIAVILAGALLGWAVLRIPPPAKDDENPLLVSHATASAAFALFAAVFVILEFALPGAPLLRAFYRTGSLVFGGGHVVLPLLDQAVVRPGWVNAGDFLAGYGAAQTIPGPLFTFAAYLGYVSRVAPNGLTGAVLCLIAIFLPGLLLAIAAAPFWQWLRARSGARAAIAGVNAAVVGLLGSALVHAGLSGAMRTWFDAIFAAAGFLVLSRTRVSPVIVVLATAFAEGLLAVLV